MTDEGASRGCGGHRTGGHRGPPLRRVTIALVGADLCAAVGDEGALRMRHTPCGYRVGPPATDATPVVPLIRPLRGHLLPCGAKAMPFLTRFSIIVSPLPRNFHENVFFPFTAGQNYDIVAQHDNCVFMPTLLVAGHGPGNSPGLHPPATRKIGQTNMKGGNFP